MPGGSYQTCDRDLKHPGDHSYLRERWPRPIPAEPDWDVQELIDRALSSSNGWYEGPSFPIIVTETVTRVLWVDAETEDDALAYWADDWTDIPLKDAEVIDGYLEFSRPDNEQRQEAFRSQGNRAERKIGPLQKCPGCDAQAFGREWLHDPYRKCHGPIAWRTSLGRPRRDWQRTPAFTATPKAATS
jgi:hypothetical protein